MDEIGKRLYDIWAAKMANNACIVEDKWEDLSELEKQAWTETAEEFARS